VVRAQDGGHVWSQPINGTLVLPALVAEDGNLYVRVSNYVGTANVEYALFAFRASDGTLLWQHSLDE
jgi:outer membrane protein assembly factor BamB